MNKNWAIAGAILAIAALTTGSVLALSPSAEAAKPQSELTTTELVALMMTEPATGQAIINNISPSGDEAFHQSTFCSTCSSSFSVLNGGTLLSGKAWAGTISENNFVLRGIIYNDVGNIGYEPTSYTLSGACGENSNISFATDSGWSGSFTANVACV